MRERLEIEQAGIAPPFAVADLDTQFALYLIEALFIDPRLHGIPDFQETAGLMNTLVVLMTEFVPERATALHLVVPRHVVEPGQQILRTGVDVVVQLTELFGILLDIGRACECAVEAQTDAVSLVIIGRRPVGSQSARRIPGLWAVVVIAGKDVM